MRSRLVELRRARCVALGALAVALGGAFAPAVAQDAELGLRGAAETLADAASPLAQAAPIQTPDAATPAPAIAPPVDGAADANAKNEAGQGRSDQAAAAEALSGRATAGLARRAGRPASQDSGADSRRAADAAAPQARSRRQAVRSDRRSCRRSQADALCRRGRRLGLQPRPEPGAASRQRLRDDRSGRGAAIGLVAQRSARPVEGRLHRLFRRPQRQFADRERHAGRPLRREPRPFVRRRRPLQHRPADARLARPRLGNGRRPRIRWSRPTARPLAARRSSAT